MLICQTAIMIKILTFQQYFNQSQQSIFIPTAESQGNYLDEGFSRSLEFLSHCLSNKKVDWHNKIHMFTKKICFALDFYQQTCEFFKAKVDFNSTFIFFLFRFMYAGAKLSRSVCLLLVTNRNSFSHQSFSSFNQNPFQKNTFETNFVEVRIDTMQTWKQ